jgi:hypothetical protein
MVLRNLSERIADSERNSYLIGLIIGVILYVVILFFNNWNPLTLLTDVTFFEFSVITGVVMRFLSGLGLALTYATFCVIFFRIMSPSLKGNKSRLKIAKVLVLIPALVIAGYAIYTIWGAIFLSKILSDLEVLSTIFGVWSLMVMVYILPIIKSEYSPDIDSVKGGGVRERAGTLRFSAWRGYQSHIRRDYGRVAEEEYNQYGAQLFIIRVILSGFLLLPISLILIVIPPLAIFGVMLWIRIFSLNHKHFSTVERGLLLLVTLTVAIITTVSFLQTEVLVFNIYFDTVYGIGLLTGLILLFSIILRK